MYLRMLQCNLFSAVILMWLLQIGNGRVEKGVKSRSLEVKLIEHLSS